MVFYSLQVLESRQNLKKKKKGQSDKIAKGGCYVEKAYLDQIRIGTIAAYGINACSGNSPYFDTKFQHFLHRYVRKKVYDPFEYFYGKIRL